MFPSSTTSSKQASFRSVNQQSTGSTVSVVGRAISTPEQTINELTFGAGVSYISLTHTPGSAPEKKEAEDQPGEIICLTSPEKPPSLPREWKVESPARRKSSQRVPLRRSQRRTPLKPANWSFQRTFVQNLHHVVWNLSLSSVIINHCGQVSCLPYLFFIFLRETL